MAKLPRSILVRERDIYMSHVSFELTDTSTEYYQKRRHDAYLYQSSIIFQAAYFH